MRTKRTAGGGMKPSFKNETKSAGDPEGNVKYRDLVRQFESQRGYLSSTQSALNHQSPPERQTSN